MFNPTYRLKRREKIFYFLTEQCPVTFDGCRKFFQIDVPAFLYLIEHCRVRVLEIECKIGETKPSLLKCTTG